jgi:hypothetical protein
VAVNRRDGRRTDPGGIDVPLTANTTGGDDIATGLNALKANLDGNENLANGTSALAANTHGSSNLALGSLSLIHNTTGSDNLASGFLALSSNTTGNDNVASGVESLISNTGSSNTAVGFGAGQNLTTGSNNIDIANDGKAGESGAIRIGTKGTQRSAFIAGISGQTVSGAAQPVVVNSKGQLGTASGASAVSASSPSDARLRAHVRRQDREIATLKREVAKLSRR